VEKELSALTQSRKSASKETRDRVRAHSETRVLAGRECAECITAKHQAMKRIHHQDSESCSPSANSSTICTFASICGVPALLEEIQYSCDVLKQVQLEAWHVANLHVLRVFSSLSREQRVKADDLLKIDQSFFYSCCWVRCRVRRSEIAKSASNEVTVVWRSSIPSSTGLLPTTGRSADKYPAIRRWRASCTVVLH